ncbi:Aminobenzoyl-glutamate transport protein [Vibrio cholerae]|nr:Aminobenzoyl-glutamate transport protein [Vibrio cholerae]
MRWRNRCLLWACTPYSVVFMVGWSLLFYVWVFVLGLPVGPGAATYYTP